MDFLKRVAYFLRWGHWPRKLRWPNGIPRVPAFPPDFHDIWDRFDDDPEAWRVRADD